MVGVSVIVGDAVGFLVCIENGLIVGSSVGANDGTAVGAGTGS